MNDLLDIFGKFEETARNDKIIMSNLEALYQSLLEQNISKLVKPYSSVQFQYLSEKLHLPVEQVETKIQAMILDGDL